MEKKNSLQIENEIRIENNNEKIISSKSIKMAQDATFETESSLDAEHIKIKEDFNPNYDS